MPGIPHRGGSCNITRCVNIARGCVVALDATGQRTYVVQVSKSKRVEVRMSLEERDMLDAICVRRRLSRSAVILSLMADEYHRLFMSTAASEPAGAVNTPGSGQQSQSH